MADQVGEELLRDLERVPVHRARHVHDEDVVAGRNLLGGHVPGRLRHEQEKVLVLALPEQQAGLDRRAAEGVLEDEVAVAAVRLGRVEGDGGDRGTVERHRGPVRRAGHPLDRHPGRERGLDVEGVRGRLALVVVRVGDPALGVGGPRRGAVGVARSHYRGVDELVHALRGDEQLGVAERDVDLVAGEDIGDVHLEDVRALLLQQARGAALAAGLLVVGARLLPLLDHRLDRARADLLGHCVDGGAGRAGEDVDRLECALPLVHVDLRHGDVGDHAGDADGGGGGLQRQAVHRGVLALDEEVRREGAVAALGLLCMCGLRGAQQSEHRHRDHSELPVSGVFLLGVHSFLLLNVLKIGGHTR